MSNFPLQFSEFGKEGYKNKKSTKKKNRTYKNHDMKKNVNNFYKQWKVLVMMMMI